MFIANGVMLQLFPSLNWGGERGSVKDQWDKFDSFEHYDQFLLSWLTECQRILKRTGTIWIRGTYHNIYRIGFFIFREGLQGFLFFAISLFRYYNNLMDCRLPTADFRLKRISPLFPA